MKILRDTGIYMRIKECLGVILFIAGFGFVIAVAYGIGRDDGHKAGVRSVEYEMREAIRSGEPITFENGGVYRVKKFKKQQHIFRVMEEIIEEDK